MPGRTRRSAAAANAPESSAQNGESGTTNNAAENPVTNSTNNTPRDQDEIMQDADVQATSEPAAAENPTTTDTTQPTTTQPTDPRATDSSKTTADRTSTAAEESQSSTESAQIQNPRSQRASASPSPPPAPPVAEAPGPRAMALHNIFNGALSHTLKMCSFDNFSACFPTPAKHVPNELRGMWRMMSQRFEELARSEFEAIQLERNVVPSLNELDRLVADAQKRKARAPAGAEVPVPPHTLPPQALYLAHLAPHLARSQSRLNARLQTTQSRNARLVDEITAQRNEITNLLGELEGVVHDLSTAADRVWSTTSGEKDGDGDAAIKSEGPSMDHDGPENHEDNEARKKRRRRLVDEIVDMQTELDHN
ncbi:Nnf1-domain-containing protein [Xylona heveae TC161]|uniref:Nnf1-domain-containing protein n=1 Tax=Xylona heveae (strain CBS 132557 / TC161) TaxID=1328760 RepID=A0A161TG31_XYLHT|nr:Nnf1-domain-containing protein [Xylona heveae TC161]KZF25057.1 Nnf1-domain-containing protein [Xylona heveae TC161]